MRSFKTILLVTAALSVWLLSDLPAQASPYLEEARSIAVQHNGRVKSFESFARQMMRLITDKERWEGQSATQLILESAADPDKARARRWIRVNHPELRMALGLDAERTYYSYDELTPPLDKIINLVRNSQAKRDQDVRPSLIEQKAENLYTRYFQLEHLTELNALLVVPPASGQVWLSPKQDTAGAPFLAMLRAVKDGNSDQASKLISEWDSNVRLKTAGAFAQKIRLELLYHSLRPFHWSWILYLGAFILLSVWGRRKSAVRAGAAMAAAAFALHTAGLALRVIILGRPPVSNMYESMIYMNWALMLVAGLFAIFKRQVTPASVGALVGAIIMIYGDLLPIDPNLEVLVPVLRSNYWLTIHVMTIVSSYGILGLAMGLGHRHLILHLRGKLNKMEEKNSENLIIRTIQIGALTLGIGTVLGGVWANESWGRFWGWDPKETWALITFLGYLIIIHLHYFKKIEAFWLAVSSVVAFQLVLMTWYGVNFVLGRGLHSYGQGSGGAIWIIYYLVAETVFLGWVVLNRTNRLQK